MHLESDRQSAGGPSRADSSGRVVSLNDGREYPVTAVSFVFGRDAGAEVVIASPDASRRHAEIVSRPDGDVLVDLSGNGTYVNGFQIPGRRPLKALDVIRIGAEEFRYYAALSEPAGPPVPPPGAAARLSDTLAGIPRVRSLATLRVKNGDAKGGRHLVLSPMVTLGRAESSDIRFSDPSVSAQHARLRLSEGVWTLTDLGSTGGSLVDGQPVTEETPLSPGTTIMLGDLAISFEPNDGPISGTPRGSAIPRLVLPASPIPATPAASVPTPQVAPAAGRPRTGSGLMIAAIVLLLAALAALVLFV